MSAQPGLMAPSLLQPKLVGLVDNHLKTVNRPGVQASVERHGSPQIGGAGSRSLCSAFAKTRWACRIPVVYPGADRLLVRCVQSLWTERHHTKS